MIAPRAPSIPVADALRHKHLFGPHFRESSWSTWKAVLKAAFGEVLTSSELQTFRTVADRDPPAHRVKEFACVAGRGAGKDSTASFVAAYIAMSFDPRAAKLRPGEVVHVLCLAVDRDQSQICFKYIRAYFEEIPVLKSLVRHIGADTIELRNRVVITVSTNSYRSVRGRSILAAVLDECAFYRSEDSQNPDVELHLALNPGLARVPGSMLILISSAHKRAGLLYDRWKQFYGKDDADVLVVRGTTRQFNLTFDQAIIDRALALDPQRYSAEYNSEWRDDLATFLSRELIEAAVMPGVVVRPPIPDCTYRAFTDPSGGMGDAFTACVAHKEPSGRIVIDCLYERRPPFNPSEVIEDIAQLLRTYRVITVTGDRYAAQFVVEAFRKCCIEYRHSKLDRSELYLGVLPIFASGQLQLIDHPRAIAQFAALERRTFPSGKDRIDHPTNGHDDIANAIAGAAVLAARPEQEVPLVSPIIIYADGTTSDNAQPQKTSTQLFYEWANGSSTADWGPV